MSEKIALSTLLNHISNELIEAQKMALQRGLATMQFEECEVELAVEAETYGEGGLKVWLVNLGGGRKKSESNTIKIKFKNIDGQTTQAEQSSEESGPQLEKQTRESKE